MLETNRIFLSNISNKGMLNSKKTRYSNLKDLHCESEVVTQGRIQDLIRGGAPDHDRPKTAILGPQFCRILVLGPHFWWSGGGPGPPGPPPWIRPWTDHACHICSITPK